MEDRPLGGRTDLNYNDDAFVFTNVSVTTPEPGSLLLVGAGLVLAAVRHRRKRAS